LRTWIVYSIPRLLSSFRKYLLSSSSSLAAAARFPPVFRSAWTASCLRRLVNAFPITQIISNGDDPPAPYEVDEDCTARFLTDTGVEVAGVLVVDAGKKFTCLVSRREMRSMESQKKFAPRRAIRIIYNQPLQRGLANSFT
jgi:hypothetical protein